MAVEGKPRSGRPANESPVQDHRQPGGPGLPQFARFKASADRATTRIPMGQGAPQLPPQRADRFGQDLPGLRFGRPSLPPRLPDSLLLRAQVLSGAGERPRRWESIAVAQEAGPSTADYHRSEEHTSELQSPM